ncbi:MAG: CPXCG motif-containing cysteine-rich protein [Pseudomonadota bacterium]
MEPVFEPGQDPGSDALEQFVDVSCPYCSETINVRADLSAGSQSYVEDCQVCCQPIMICVNVEPTAETEWSLTATRAS